jgi:hypothetical protein
MNLRTHPKMKWQGQPAWNPASWSWMTTIEIGASRSSEGIESYGKLISVRQFPEKNGGAALELLVGFEKAVYSAVIRLDDSSAIPDLFAVLDSLHGHSLKEIGNIQLANVSSRIVEEKPSSDEM